MIADATTHSVREEFWRAAVEFHEEWNDLLRMLAAGEHMEKLDEAQLPVAHRAAGGAAPDQAAPVWRKTFVQRMWMAVKRFFLHLRHMFKNAVAHALYLHRRNMHANMTNVLRMNAHQLDDAEMIMPTRESIAMHTELMIGMERLSRKQQQYLRDLHRHVSRGGLMSQFPEPDFHVENPDPPPFNMEPLNGREIPRRYKEWGKLHALLERHVKLAGNRMDQAGKFLNSLEKSDKNANPDYVAAVKQYMDVLAGHISKVKKVVDLHAESMPRLKNNQIMYRTAKQPGAEDPRSADPRADFAKWEREFNEKMRKRFGEWGAEFGR